MSNSMRLRVLSVLALLALPAAAQGVIVVPASFSGSDGPTFGGVAGLVKRQRQQIVLTESALTGLTGRSLTRIEFRRDGQYDKALRGGRADVSVRVGTTSQSLDALSPSFASNLGASAPVALQGTIDIPPSPQLLNRNEPTWAGPYAVAIPFATPVPYVQGNLVLDLAGSPVSGQATDWWPVDYAADLTAGSVTRIGTGCGWGADLGVSIQQLVVGSTARFVAGGQPSSVSALLLAATRVPPVDLTFLGAPGCQLRVMPLATLTVGAGVGSNGSPGTANHELHFPLLPSLVGGSLATQAVGAWIDGSGAHLSVSPALDVQLAPGLATLAGATIDSVFVTPNDPFPTSGRVRRTRVPVVRLTHD